MSLRFLLTLSGSLEALVGVLALLVPAVPLSVLFGAPAEPVASAVTRLFGAAIFSLGFACIAARDNVDSAAGLALCKGMTGYNLLAAGVLVWIGNGLGLGSLLVWAAAGGHAALGGCFVAALMRSRR